MEEYSAAAPRNTWLCVVIDLDNKIVETVLAREAVAVLTIVARDRPVVVSVGGIFRPCVARLDRSHR